MNATTLRLLLSCRVCPPTHEAVRILPEYCGYTLRAWYEARRQIHDRGYTSQRVQLTVRAVTAIVYEEPQKCSFFVRCVYREIYLLADSH